MLEETFEKFPVISVCNSLEFIRMTRSSNYSGTISYVCFLDDIKLSCINIYLDSDKNH